MNEQENIQIAQEGYLLFTQGDIDNLLDLYTDDITFVFHGSSDLTPFTDTFRGKDQMRQFFAKVADILVFDSYETREFIGKGNKVIVLGHDKCTDKTTGISMETDWAHVLTMRDGKTARLESYGDVRKMMTGFALSKHQEV
jgi:hypothetical protein